MLSPAGRIILRMFHSHTMIVIALFGGADSFVQIPPLSRYEKILPFNHPG